MRYQIKPYDRCFFDADNDDIAKAVGFILGGCTEICDEHENDVLKPYEGVNIHKFKDCLIKNRAKIADSLEGLYYVGHKDGDDDIKTRAKSAARQLREK